MKTNRINHQPEPAIRERPHEVTFACEPSGKIIFLSEEGERLSGYSCEQACRMNIADLLDPAIAAQAGEQILRDAQTQVGNVYEIEIMASDGRRVPVEVSTGVVLRDAGTIEVRVIAVPVSRDPNLSLSGLRCVDEKFFFALKPMVNDPCLSMILSSSN